MNGQDPRQLLARRLRSLRERHWPARKITQPELARALGGLSVPLISSWETQNNPTIPPLTRLDAYATFFATARSLEPEPHLLRPADLTDCIRFTVENQTGVARTVAGYRVVVQLDTIDPSGDPF